MVQYFKKETASNNFDATNIKIRTITEEIFGTINHSLKFISWPWVHSMSDIEHLIEEITL